ncbi:Uncaracterized surface protein containing fasciclin (FAS1) repeats [Pedobacter sp. ok626]|uniref:fasciclin domain-containing protein n=1 Tax=Pedobacter sp. ok626 TaxID=1761882 RepID=UPI0008900491|nr:fasciclin domain-containing protein [Pedobacter sp. ok626]SDL41504.1 Uncaracterized surface protein containing fasciclin (FAS1) repeats [Pedobacter sp. ok626]
MKKTVKKMYTMIGILLMLVVGLLGCKREHMTLATTSDVNITGYLDLYPEKFSLFSEIIKKSGSSGFLGAYGSYTIFAPTNDAVNLWLKTLNKSAVAEVDVNALKDMVKFHLISDTISTSKFTDGKLRLTEYGQYLITGASNTGGVTRYTINKQSNILQANIRTGNGIIHVLDHVLVPASKTVAQIIEGNSRYSIFTQALKATGLYDTLNTINNIDTTRRFLTAIAESDSALRVAGFTSYEQLRLKLSTKNNPKDHADSLWLYVAYHVLPGANYMADLVSAESFPTIAPNEVIVTKKSSQDVILNEVTFNDVTEVGVPLIRNHSDISAKNGVVNDASKYFKIKVRNPDAVYFDLGEQPELRAQTSFFRQLGKIVDINTSGNKSLCAGITFQNASATTVSSYVVDGSLTGTTFYTAYNDYLAIQLGQVSSRHTWVQFKTPMLVKGKYKVWLCYRAQSSKAPNLQATMNVGTANEQTLPNIASMISYLDASGVSLSDPNSDNLMLAQGYKRYSFEQPNGTKNNAGRLLGVADITTTGYQTIRFTCVNGTYGALTWLDMIHFIPIDQDQKGCRFKKTSSDAKICGF